MIKPPTLSQREKLHLIKGIKSRSFQPQKYIKSYFNSMCETLTYTSILGYFPKELDL